MKVSRSKGIKALSPLLVFVGVYLVSSILANDFYKIPVASAFIIAAIYALSTTKGKLSERINVFSKGAGNRNVMLMIWIFAMAGAFANTAKEIGAVESTVNLAVGILPGNLIFAGLFLASCLVSMAMGTSVGTIVALVPIASGIAAETGSSIPLVTAIVAGGAFFGDNLSFISDTTIAATNSQGCRMKDKFKANLGIAAPAAVITLVIYILLGSSVSAAPQTSTVSWVFSLPYLLVILLSVLGMNVLGVLSLGLLSNAAIGFAYGKFSWSGFLSSMGNGIGSMGELITVTLLAGGLLEIIRYNGGLDYIIERLTSRVKGKAGAESSIAALVSLVNVCTANNTIAIITTGDIARDISERYGISSKRSASILDTFSCIVQSILPYGAQMLMAGALAGIPVISVISHMYYPFILAGIAVLSILYGWIKAPRQAD